MDLPAPLRLALEGASTGIPREALRAAARRMTERYRTNPDHATIDVRSGTDALAYAAVRMPATFAAVAAALAGAADRLPDFDPATHLDVGSGPGTAAFAATAVWDRLRAQMLLERDPQLAALGQRLMADAGHAIAADWRAADLLQGVDLGGPFDLVTCAYVLGELPEAARPGLVDRLWAATGGLLVLVEPGSRAGHARVIAARDRLIAAGGHAVAPCPHMAACPVPAGDWCHFAARLARSRLHRDVKDGDRGFEDEPFSYVAVSRGPGDPAAYGRVLRPPQVGKAGARLRLCVPPGAVEDRMVPSRDKPAFRRAKDADWGDAFGLAPPD